MPKNVRVGLLILFVCLFGSVILLVTDVMSGVHRRTPDNKPRESVSVETVSAGGVERVKIKTALTYTMVTNTSLSAACDAAEWSAEDVLLQFPYIVSAEPALVGDLSGDGDNEMLLIMSNFSTSEADILILRRGNDGHYTVSSRRLSRGNFSVGVQTNSQREVSIVVSRAGEYTVDADTIGKRLKRRRIEEQATLRFHGGELEMVTPWTITDEKVVWVPQIVLEASRE